MDKAEHIRCFALGGGGKQKSPAAGARLFAAIFARDNIPIESILVYSLHVSRAQSLGGALDVVLNFFSVTETVIPAEAFNVVAVYENVFASVARFDEAESFFGVEPFYFTLCHCVVRCVSSLNAGIEINLKYFRNRVPRRGVSEVF